MSRILKYNNKYSNDKFSDGDDDAVWIDHLVFLWGNLDLYYTLFIYSNLKRFILVAKVTRYWKYNIS